MATCRTAAPSELSQNVICCLREKMVGSRLVRVFLTILLLIPVFVMGGCMGFTGQNNNKPSNPSTPPNVPVPPANPTPANPTATITVTPTSVQAGDKVTVSWQTQNASTITLTQNDKPVALDGNPLNSQGMQFTLNTVGTTTF